MQKKLRKQFYLGLTYIDWNLGATNTIFHKFSSQKPISALNWLVEF